MTEQIGVVKRICGLVAIISRILEIVMYPFLYYFIIAYGYAPLIGNDTDFIRSFGEFSTYGKVINYMSNHVGVNLTYVLLLFAVLSVMIIQIVVMNKVHCIFKRISRDGKIFSEDSVKPLKEVTALSMIFIMFNIPNVIGLFFSVCALALYKIYKYQSESEALLKMERL